MLSASFFNYYFDDKLLRTGTVPPGAARILLWDEGQRCPAQTESSSSSGKMNTKWTFLLPTPAALLLSHILAPFFLVADSKHAFEISLQVSAKAGSVIFLI